jgi:hypothetical protein
VLLLLHLPPAGKPRPMHMGTIEEEAGMRRVRGSGRLGSWLARAATGPGAHNCSALRLDATKGSRRGVKLRHPSAQPATAGGGAVQPCIGKAAASLRSARARHAECRLGDELQEGPPCASCVSVLLVSASFLLFAWSQSGGHSWPLTTRNKHNGTGENTGEEWQRAKEQAEWEGTGG